MRPASGCPTHGHLEHEFQALADTVAGLRAAPPWEHRAAKHPKIVLTGMGSSLHALHPLQLHLVRAGHTAIMVETGELIHTQANLLDDRTMVVVVSQSGRSVETLQLLDLLSDEVFVLVFSGDPATAAMNEALVRDVRAAGGRAALVGALVERGAFRLPEVPARLRPVVEMLPVQMVSLALGALAGREAGRFERASKITTIA